MEHNVPQEKLNWDPALAVIVFTRRFTTLIDAGLS
jgi:hypothetical protein